MVLSPRLAELRKSFKKKCYINSLSRQMGVTQLNRSGRMLRLERGMTRQHEGDCKYYLELESKRAREAVREEPGKQSVVWILKSPMNHDWGLNSILKAVGSHPGILTMVGFTLQKVHSAVGYNWRKEGDCRQGQ